MMRVTVFRNATLPTAVGPKPVDILVCGGQIAAITARGQLKPSQVTWAQIETMDCSECIALPGLVDPHVHILGGGGGDGYGSYVPGPQASDLTSAGITSVIGCLGFDSTSRNLVALVRKAKSLRRSGMGAWCLTGGFNYPPQTITGDVRTDLVTVDEFVGSGELSLGDFRGPALTAIDLANYATSTRTGGMLGGKAGVLHIHLGQDEDIVNRISRALAAAPAKPDSIHLTHVNRHEAMLKTAAGFARSGGYLDVTTHLPVMKKHPVAAPDAVKMLLELGVDPDRITVSSDGFGGLKVAENDSFVYKPSPVEGLFECATDLIKSGLDHDQAWKFVSGNAARLYKLAGRSELAAGAVADILLLEAESLALKQVIVGGQITHTGNGV